MSVYKNLAKAKMESLTIKLHYLNGVRITCKVSKLSGTTVDVAIDGEQEKRTIGIDSIVGVEFVNEKAGESV